MATVKMRKGTKFADIAPEMVEEAKKDGYEIVEAPKTETVQTVKEEKSETVRTARTSGKRSN